MMVDGTPRPVEPGVELAAYRVVQEGLTNALKYATGAPTEVLVGYGPGGLTVAVLDRGRPSGGDVRDGTGRGLLGLRERVALYHGEFHAGRRAGGGYEVRARFPWEIP
jgi:signal transduction histidine kinase